MSQKGERSCVDIEAGPHHSYAEDPSWHSPYNSRCTHLDEFRFSGGSTHEIDGPEEARRSSFISDCSFEVDLECGSPEIIIANLEKAEKDCRICHLSLESKESGVSIVLGCSCKDDLAAAHKQCAETWFKIRGNKTCEICGSTAKNVVTPGETELIELSNETSTNTMTPPPPSETRSFWQGHRFLNFLLACMIFAFVISWLFHFNVPG